MKKFPLLLALLAIVTGLQAQKIGEFWHKVSNAEFLTAQNDPSAKVWAFQGLRVDFSALQQRLTGAPGETSPSGLQVTLPLPDGQSARFEVHESPVMEPGLAAKYPTLKSYKGRSLTSGVGAARFDLTEKGVHASIQTVRGTVFIDPYGDRAKGYHIVYYLKDSRIMEDIAQFRCDIYDSAEDRSDRSDKDGKGIGFRNDEETLPLRVYRLALACTGEYAQFHGGTTELALSAMVATVNRLNQIFERDLGLRVILVEDNDKVVFLDGDTDPYTNGQADAMLAENQKVLNDSIGFVHYDIGHVLGTHPSLSGVASRGGVCDVDKGRAASTSREPDAGAFTVAIVAHEMGHQFNAQHSFNSCHNVNPTTGYEPGGGTTIMSYAGICSDPVNNLQFTADDYYHVISLQEIHDYITKDKGDGCPEKIMTSNHAPSVKIPLNNGFYIPLSTPFELVAEGTDPDGDALTYTWEQFDLGPALSPPGSPEEDSPLFRSFEPTADPGRMFPRLSKILNNAFDRSEVLPAYGRNLTFRCTVRDNNPEAGGIDWAEVRFLSDDRSGPFRIMAPNNGQIFWETGDYAEVTWDVANTDNQRVNCQTVNIRLSVDGGQTFPILLVEGTPNDGSAFVTVPNVPTGMARLRVEAADNIFFDLSDANFEIRPATRPGYTVDINPVNKPRHCLPDEVLFDIEMGSVLGYNEPLTLELIGDLPSQATYNFSHNPMLPMEDHHSLLTIDLGTFVEDTFNLQVRVAAPGLDTSYREIRFVTVSNDYSMFRPLTPPDGTRGIVLSADFSWSDVTDADTYEFDIASNPAFEESIIESATGLTDTTYVPDMLFEDSQVLYWRVRPVNECGPGPYLPVQAFQTANIACTEFVSTDVPVNISGTGRPTVESTIFVDQQGVISDLNIPVIKANYQPVKSLRITLISPAGTEAILYNRDCGNTVRFLVGFDDDAPETIGCPPDDGIVFRPRDSLSVFKGEEIFGAWKLRVAVVEPGFGASGAIENWSLEFCADFAADDPFLLRNDTLRVPPGLTNPISNALLEADDNISTLPKIRYTIVNLPQHGLLLLNGDTLQTGQAFSQEDINNFRLKYRHDGSMTERDSFTFTIVNDSGGWLPTTSFNIAIDEDATVGINDVFLQSGFEIYPNPLREEMNLYFQERPKGTVWLRIFNVNGQELFRRQSEDPGETWTIDMHSLRPGLYFITLQTEDGIATKKVVVE